jgi:hypothetical protein
MQDHRCAAPAYPEPEPHKESGPQPWSRHVAGDGFGAIANYWSGVVRGGARPQRNFPEGSTLEGSTLLTEYFRGKSGDFRYRNMYLKGINIDRINCCVSISAVLPDIDISFARTQRCGILGMSCNMCVVRRT